MKNIFIRLYYIIIFIIIHNLRKCLSHNVNVEKNNENEKHFILETLNKFNETNIYSLNYDYNTNTFKEYYEIITNIKESIICHENDYGKVDGEVKTLKIWNPSNGNTYYSTSLYINLFPIWYRIEKEKGERFCLSFESVGWYNNAYSPICKEDYPCPDIIIVGTSQITARYYNNETISFNGFFRNYLKKKGKPLENYINNNWLAVPFVTDIRVFKFNITTFNYCREKGYDLHYPPWTWEKVFEYAEMITECTNIPGFKILENAGEDFKFFSTICQSLNIPLFMEESNIKKCGLRKKEYIKKLEILKKLVENHHIESWFVEKEINDWKSKPYPQSVEVQPAFSYNNEITKKLPLLNGMKYDNLHSVDFNSENLAYSVYNI
ncbi:hypothetical protein PIROE2DRAFT_1984 [Piromyces sp. E2]|nr:hypothetical protein PIROE2DRAFT_1984 [Piromyces sp. E2]|eukprot:OUM70035.1 hypothetical protein PIROE2DRAFT_1984 [Piromyces sp. E2]